MADDRNMVRRGVVAWGLRVGIRPMVRRLLNVVRSTRIRLSRSGDRGKTCKLMLGVILMVLGIAIFIDGMRDGGFSGWRLRQVPTAGAKPLKIEDDRDDAWWAERDQPPDPNVDEVGICYFMQIDGKSIPLLERLFARLWHPRNTYIVHVDWKVKEEDYGFVRSLVDNNEGYKTNFHFVEREAVTYKGISMVLNTIAAMTVAVNVSSDWKYFVNLSGADYPLVSPTSLRKLLARPRVANGRLNFVTLFPLSQWKAYSFRMRSQYWDVAVVGAKERDAKTRRMKALKKWPLDPYRKFVFSKAEAWSIFSRRFVQFVVRSTFAKRMLLAHTHVLSVPEHYFINVLYNHPYWRKTIVPDAFRKVVWHHAGKRSGQHPYILDQGKQINSYWIYLKETRSVFARKVSVPNSPLMERIDAELSGNVQGKKLSEKEESDRIQRSEVFYRRLASHFDQVTKRVLESQEVQWPREAYPKVIVQE